MRITFRPTAAADLAFINEPLPYRIQAITALAGDRVLGIGGLGFHPDGSVVAFVHMREEARKYPAAIHRAGLLAMRMIRSSRYPLVVAEADPDNPAATRWLRRLGFREIQTAGVTAYVWERNKN